MLFCDLQSGAEGFGGWFVYVCGVVDHNVYWVIYGCRGSSTKGYLCFWIKNQELRLGHLLA